MQSNEEIQAMKARVDRTLAVMMYVKLGSSAEAIARAVASELPYSEGETFFHGLMLAWHEAKREKPREPGKA